MPPATAVPKILGGQEASGGEVRVPLQAAAQRGRQLGAGGGPRNAEAVSRCLGPSGTWPQFSSPPFSPLLSECFPGLHWGQRRSPPAPGPVLLGEPVRIICCFGSTALGGNRRRLWGGRRGKLCLPEGSSVLWDPAGAAPFNRCLTCCGMPGEGGIACTCPQGRRELCGGCLQKAWG